MQGHNQLKKNSITPRGTQTFLSDNPNLDRSPAVVYQPEPHKVKFFMVHQNIDRKTAKYMSEREFKKGELDRWDDKAWIQKLNGWRRQTFDRCFQHDTEY